MIRDRARNRGGFADGGTPSPSAPVNTVPPALSGSFFVGQTLTCSTGTWTGFPAPTYTYQWRNAGVDIGGATSSTYVLQAGDDGDSIDCVVTATNGSGSASQVSNALIALATLVWIDPSDTSTITQVSNLVSQINDKSGNGYNLTQGTGSRQPLTGNTRNSRNVLRYDGSGDTMEVPNAAVSAIAAGSFSAFFVSGYNSTSYRSWLFYGNAAFGITLSEGGGATSRGRFNTGEISIAYPADTLTHIYAFSRNGTAGRFIIDSTVNTGTIGSSGSVPASNYVASFNSSSDFLNGDIGEFVIAARFWNSSEETQVINYLKAKWGTV